ncbi:Imm1 family immunity protein [Saccharomonospora saliphila]|uniref:Imm1 family immunity protein n=1 Tax=Saccharomonospora saliphila TaxID=369829 RepID=UPI000376A76C|nr:Imm1 family immunity protein [Saccharomonospora saliphila]
MRVHEASTIVDTIHDHARRADAVRRKVAVLERADWTTHDDVWGTTTGPDLDIYVGPGVGLLIWACGDETLITSGGQNAEPVAYAVDEWAHQTFPAGVEIPVDSLATAVREFLAHGGRPASVGWTHHDIVPG